MNARDYIALSGAALVELFNQGDQAAATEIARRKARRAAKRAARAQEAHTPEKSVGMIKTTDQDLVGLSGAELMDLGTSAANAEVARRAANRKRARKARDLATDEGDGQEAKATKAPAKATVHAAAEVELAASATDADDGPAGAQDSTEEPRARLVAPASLGAPEQVVMGVDIGTSLSKVVVSFRGRRLAIPLEPAGRGASPYLLPTALSVMNNGECRLGLHNGAMERYDDIKKPLIDGKINDGVVIPLIAFMALLFRRVQDQVEELWSRMLGGRVDWLVNLGVPTESYGGGKDGERDLVHAFCFAAERAWKVAERLRSRGGQEPLTIERCRDEVKDVSNEELATSRELDRIAVFPEFVAQVASYVRSKQRQEGTHVLIDVGGGTLDVTVFQVHSVNRDDEPFSIWARTVKPLGTRYLTDYVTENCCDRSEDLRLSPFEPLPSEAEMARIFGISLVRLREVTKAFRREVGKAVGDTVHRAGSTFPKITWPGRLFLGGGGAFVKPYMQVADEFCQKNEWKYRVDRVLLPVPDDLEAPEIDDPEWHRLAVAYGLCRDPFDMVGIIPPEEIEPVPATYWKPPSSPPRWT